MRKGILSLMIVLISWVLAEDLTTLEEGDFATFEPVPSGTTYYVSDKGNDANTGLSEEEAFRTLQHASDLTKPGDQVFVMDGVYTKPGPFTNVLEIHHAGEPDKYIFYTAMPGHKPLIKVDNNYAGIRTTVPYIVIDGFTIEGTVDNLSFEEAEKLALGTDKDAALKNSIFNSTGIHSFPADDGSSRPHHLIFRNNTVYNHPGGGIGSNGSDYVRIENNVVYNNSQLSPFATSGISFYQSREVDEDTGIKMYIRNNLIYNNENKVPFWFSDERNPAGRFISDGNGIIIDDARNTQSFVGKSSTPYSGTFLIENNVVYNNGGKAINIYSSDNVIARHNTTYHNGRSPGINAEIGLGSVANVLFLGNIFVTEEARKPITSYSAQDIHFSNNLFYGGSEAPQYLTGTQPNLLENGDFSVGSEPWTLEAELKGAEQQRDKSYRLCVTVPEHEGTNPTDVRVVHHDLTLKQGYTYTLRFEVSSTNKTKADFTVGVYEGTSKYIEEIISLPVGEKTASQQTLSFTPKAASTRAALAFHVAGNLEASSFCFDNVMLVESADILNQDPRFVNGSTDPAKADFRLLDDSPARDAAFGATPNTDIEKTPRPKGEGSDLGAYESF
ncbi:MAG: carbohydrate binding domain-containing protein [Trueperaceae bacterium]